jgi:class 3 adenylate cyclase/tetratricopeptide (TPR) repeat protein
MNEPTATAYIPIDRRLALAHGSTLPDRTTGTALFADISGFTSLTEALVDELGPQRGPEELTHYLNQVYTALIDLVHRFHGAVIGFSGDAITCWFDGDTGRQATTCALAMQDVMGKFARITTPAGTTISLSIKVAAVAGPARRFLVGDPDTCLIDALAGHTLERLAAAGKEVDKGQVLVGQEIGQQLGDQLTVSKWRQAQGHQGKEWLFAVIAAISSPAPASPWPEDIPLPAEEVRRWLLPAVHRRLEVGQGEFLAELRPAAALFLRFSGIAYDTDPQAGPKLDAFIRWVQGVLSRYEGNLLQLTIGDKGSYLYAAFGAPIAQDDDAARAVAAALSLQSPPPELAFIDPPQIGMAFGRMRTGAYGSPARRTYGVLGDKVNLAARLMEVAGPGEIRCEYDLYEHAGGQWDFLSLPPVRVKGKASLVRLYAPTGRAATRRLSFSREQAAFVGREQELGQLRDALDAAEGGAFRVLLITGEAGIGKSRLTAEFTRLLREHGHPWLEGAGSSIEQLSPYRAWRDVFSLYLGLDGLADLTQHRARLQETVREIAPHLLDRLPLINDVLGTDLPDTDLTASLDPKLHQQSLFALLVDLLRAWARERPVVLILDDVQWLDGLSWEFARYCTRALSTSGAPSLIILVSRPPAPLSPAARHLEDLCRSLDVETIAPAAMSPDETVDLATAVLGLPIGALPTPVADLVRRQADGNPFFAQELALALRDQGILSIQTDAPGGPSCTVPGDIEQVAQSLPDTIQGLVLARIDRLPLEVQLTLKVAAVIGRSFAYPALFHTLRRHMETTPADLDAHLELLSALDMILLDVPEPERSYLFRHILTQEAAYQTLLFAQRRQLHRMVAEWYKTTFGEEKVQDQISRPLAPYLPLLVYHYAQAEDKEQERIYARLAGEQSAAQFANEEAIRYLSRALELTPEDDPVGRYEVLLAREEVYHLRGRREEQASDLATLARLAEQLDSPLPKATVALRQATYARHTGDLGQAIASAQAAIAAAIAATTASVQEVTDPAGQAESVRSEISGQIVWGEALLWQGEYQSAQDHLTRALEAARSIGDASREIDALRGLGILYIHRSDFVTARAYIQQALAICRQVKNRPREGDALNNLGIISGIMEDYVQANEYFAQVLAIFQEIGHRSGEGKARGNMGVVANSLGEYELALAHYQQSLTIHEEIGDRIGVGSAFVNLGNVYYNLGEYAQAEANYRQSLAINQETGDRPGEMLTLIGLGSVLTRLGQYGQSADCLQRARIGHQEMEDPMGEGSVLNCQGTLAYIQGQYEQARSCYEQALALRQASGLISIAEDRAGLALVDLVQGELDQASAEVEEILAIVNDDPHLSGATHPGRVFLACYQVLQAGQDPRTDEILAQARTLLQQRAAKIADPALRHSFLQNVPEHRQLLAPEVLPQMDPLELHVSVIRSHPAAGQDGTPSIWARSARISRNIPLPLVLLLLQHRDGQFEPGMMLRSGFSHLPPSLPILGAS